MKCLIVLLVILSIASTSFAAAVMHTESYTVQAGDTLDSIATHYATIANIEQGKAYMAFREGIVELNYPLLKNKCPKEGDVLTINYWVF